MGHHRHEISVACGSQGSTGSSGGGESLNPSGRRDQVTASLAAAVPQDLGNRYQSGRGQCLLVREKVQSREVAARPRPAPVGAAGDVEATAVLMSKGGTG